MPTTDDVDVRAAQAAKALAARPPAGDPRLLVARARNGDPYEAVVSRARPRWPIPAAAAAAVLAVVVGSFAFDAATDDRSILTAPPGATTPTTVRSSYDSGRVPIFTADGEPADVVDAYLRSRFPDFPNPGVTVDSVDLDFPNATATWSTHETDGRVIARGTITLTRNDLRWSVVRATTDGVELAVTVSPDDGRIQGRVTSAVASFGVDVLDLDGAPMPGSPFPNGQPGAAYRWGTAGTSKGGPGSKTVDIDLPGSTEPVVVRAQLVGGTMLSISEVVLDAGPTGSVVAEGTWKGGSWVLERAASVRGVEGSPCGWILLNGLRGAPSCGDASAREVRRAGAFDGEALFFARVPDDVTRIRIRPEGAPAVEAATIADPLQPGGPRLAVLAVPSLATVEVTFLGADGQELPPTQAVP